MASVKFYLRSAKSDPSAIMGRLYYSGKEFVFSTGYSVSPKNWSQKTQRVSTKERAANDINTFLINKSAEVMNVHDELKRDGKLDNENIKLKLSGKDVDNGSLYGFIEKTLENRLNLNLKNKNGCDPVYIKYKNTFNRVKEFAKKKYRRDIEFNDIDLNFYNDFIKFLREYPLAESTVGKEVKTLKRFLNLATIQGVNTQMIFKSSEFKAPDEKVKHIYLDEDEINHLFDMYLTGHMEKARDIFIIGCRTSLRVSDYGKCIDDNVEQSGLICIDETDKTGEPVYIPMHWQVRLILDKYNGLPPLISDQKLNDYIKELGKKAGFDKMVKDTRRGRNKPTGSGDFCPKYELITTHTARRSCATNLYMAGFDLYFIQGILGHKKIATTIQYIGVTRKLIALQLVNNKYFTGVTGYVTE